MEIELVEPIIVEGVEKKSLKFSRVTLGDIKMLGIKNLAELDDMNVFSKVAAFMTKMSQEEFDSLDMRDWNNVIEAGRNFFLPSPQSLT